MDPKKILIQLDSDPQPSVFDRVVAIDAGVDDLFSYGGVTVEQVRSLVYGAIFTRGLADLKQTAIFIGGSDVGRGEALLEAARGSFFGPLRVSLMLDANGANTTAAAAVLAAARERDLGRTTALVLGGTGPVGRRAARLLARQGAAVRLGSRDRDRAAQARAAMPDDLRGRIEPVAAAGDALAAALEDVELVIAAGAAGAVLLPLAARRACPTLKVAIDLNAVPPAGIEGIKPTDKAADRDGVTAYGAVGVGGTKMKIHREALHRLFESNDLVLDAEEIFAIGRGLG